MRVPIAVLLAVLAAGGLAGCGQAGTSARPSVGTAISAQQEEALRDGEISWDEYESGFQAYQACLARNGYELADPRVEGDRMEFGVPGDAVDSGMDEECYSHDWAQVDQAWQIAHQDTSESARIVAACLRTHGVEPHQRYAENLDELDRHGIALADCPADG